MDEELLKEYVTRLGWPIVPHSPNTFRSAHMTNEGEMTVYLRLHENWLVASVVPFLATRGDNSFELSRWLLRMNRDMSLAKFAYDEDGDVTVTVELPTENIDFVEVEWALQELLSQAIAHRATLRAAAEAP